MFAAMCIHFFLLVAFMWMLTQGFYLYTAFVKVCAGAKEQGMKKKGGRKKTLLINI